jgi:hypothetical protein
MGKMPSPHFPPALPEFQAFLKERRLAPEKNIPFLAHWAARFSDFVSRHPAMPTTERLPRFLNGLSERLKNWQVRQAAAAVQIYPTHYRHRQAENPSRKIPLAPSRTSTKIPILAS